MKDQHYFCQVFEVTQLIPRGRITNYGAIANYLSLGSARMVGWALNKCSLSEEGVPAHRVVNSKGELSGRSAFTSPTMMQELLESEGVIVENDKVKDFKKLFWDPSEELPE
ncbi:MAG: methylated-DNA-protein-cysteine methyltransferase-like protein [Patescibacteria group bacterium]|jgi:methylated-DNA-protein-cysteine methyltransferase-like protein